MLPDVAGSLHALECRQCCLRCSQGQLAGWRWIVAHNWKDRNDGVADACSVRLAALCMGLFWTFYQLCSWWAAIQYRSV